jgi:proteic killer suppression protein
MQQDDDCRIQFRDHWLYEFFKFGKANRKIPPALHGALARKLDMLNAADEKKDLASPRGNRLENLNPPLTGFLSIRVNDKYRLIFKWGSHGVEELYLDPHDY